MLASPSRGKLRSALKSLAEFRAKSGRVLFRGASLFLIQIESYSYPTVFYCILPVFPPYSAVFFFLPYSTRILPRILGGHFARKISNAYSCRILVVFLLYSSLILFVYGIREEYSKNTTRIPLNTKNACIPCILRNTGKIQYRIRSRIQQEYG